jgi:hypothetical protein
MIINYMSYTQKTLKSVLLDQFYFYSYIQFYTESHKMGVNLVITIKDGTRRIYVYVLHFFPNILILSYRSKKKKFLILSLKSSQHHHLLSIDNNIRYHKATRTQPFIPPNITSAVSSPATIKSKYANASISYICYPPTDPNILGFFLGRCHNFFQTLNFQLYFKKKCSIQTKLFRIHTNTEI